MAIWREGKMMKHGKILYGRYRVYVGKELMSIETSWGYPYTLYKEYNGTRYFADGSEGFNEVEEINASSDQEAIELFKEIMRLKEDEQEEQ
jgi:hypothetical protein